MLQDINNSAIFLKILFHSYSLKTKSYGCKVLQFLISQDFQIIIDLWNMQHYAYMYIQSFYQIKVLAMMKIMINQIGSVLLTILTILINGGSGSGKKCAINLNETLTT